MSKVCHTLIDARRKMEERGTQKRRREDDAIEKILPKELGEMI